MKEKIEVGDFVAPIIEKFDDDLLEELDVSSEDLYGFVTEKNENIITVSGIARNVETIWNEDKFIKSDIPEIFNEKGSTRCR